MPTTARYDVPPRGKTPVQPMEETGAIAHQGHDEQRARVQETLLAFLLLALHVFS